MEAAFAELPLALFTTLAPMGAGAFIALALAFFTTTFTDDQVKKIDRMTLIPLVVVLVGVAASFFHLASPLHAAGVFAGIGSSPLSNEILVGSLFVVLALVYVILALAGKLSGGARKGFVAVVAVAAAVFACFTGMAYMMETIASWNSPLVVVQLLGFALLGGMPLGTLVLGLAGALPDALKGSFKTVGIVVAAAGAVLAIGGFCVQVMGVGGMENALVSGADLVADVTIYLAVAVASLVLAAAGTVAALLGKSPVAMAGFGAVMAVIGIFVARLVFYAVQLSVGLSF